VSRAESTAAVQHVALLCGLSMAHIETPVSATMGTEPADSSTLPQLQLDRVLAVVY